MQGWIREQTFSPENEKTLRRFSSWEVSEQIFGLNQSTFRDKLAADPTLPAGKVEPDGRQRWFTPAPPVYPQQHHRSGPAGFAHLGLYSNDQLSHGFEGTLSADKVTLPKVFQDTRFLLTRYEPGNDLHRAMRDAFGKVFGDKLATHPVEMTRPVEQSGRFLSSIYERDYRDMTRETWRRARGNFDQAYGEFRDVMLPRWDNMNNPTDQTLSADKAAREGEQA